MVFSLKLLPSFVMLGGIFFLQVTAFVYISDLNYSLMAVVFAILLALVVFGCVWLIPKVINWGGRAELSVMLSFVQIVIAMFLPIIVNEIKVPYSNLIIDYESILVTVGVFVGVISIGILLYKYKLNKRYGRDY